MSSYELYESPFTGEEVDEYLTKAKYNPVIISDKMTNGYGGSVIITPSTGQPGNFITNEIVLEGDAHYKISIILQASWGDKFDAILECSQTGISEAVIGNTSDPTVYSAGISYTPINAKVSGNIEVYILEGTFKAASSASLRFFINPTTNNVAVYSFSVQIEKILYNYKNTA